MKRQLAILGGSALVFGLGVAFRRQLSSTPWGIAEYAVFLIPYLASGWPVLAKAFRNILRGKFFDENFLMTLATAGAFAIGELPEAVAVMVFFQLGELLEGLSARRSRNSIKALLEFKPESAVLLTSEGEKTVPPADARVGDTMVIRPGERIPLDGDVLSGSSLVDTSTLTGEPVPRSVSVGAEVLAGSINGRGSLIVRVTRELKDSSVARILDMVENAIQKKARTERFISRFARYYTPLVVVAAVLIAAIPPLVLPGAILSDWMHRALVVLVVSCPCALVISIPLGYFGGIGGASHRGILLKGSQHLDTLAEVDTVVFDKTGTLTEGIFRVRAVVPVDGIGEKELLRVAAFAESHSNHPIASSIKQAYGGPVDPKGGDGYEEIAGHGVIAAVDGSTVVAGNDRLLHREGIAHPVCAVDGTVVHVARGGLYMGHIIIGDALREEARRTVQSLKRMGVRRVLMLTGDTASGARGMCAELEMDGCESDLLPEAKVSALERIIASGRNRGKVLFLGDGMNDAPVIARADLGAAMGGFGSDAAIETADMVVMTDSLSKVPLAIAIGRKTRAIVWQNIAFALAIKLLFIFLATIGVATMWEAVFADMGVALAAILNAGRTFRMR